MNDKFKTTIANAISLATIIDGELQTEEINSINTILSDLQLNQKEEGSLSDSIESKISILIEISKTQDSAIFTQLLMSSLKRLIIEMEELSNYERQVIKASIRKIIHSDNKIFEEEQILLDSIA